MLPRILLFLALLLPAPLAAQSLAGTWAFDVEEATIFRFAIEREGEDWKAVWERPQSFASNGVDFARVTGPVVTIPAAEIRQIGEWTELTFNDPRPGAVPDVFMLRAIEDGGAEAVYVGTGFAPLALERVLASEPIAPWEPQKTYRRADAASGLPGALVQFSSPGAVPPALAERPAIAAEPMLVDDELAPSEEPEEVQDEAEPLPPVEDDLMRQPAMIGR